MPDIIPQLIEQVRSASDSATALNIKGRSSKSFYGRLAVGEALNIGEHTGIVSHQPTELVLTARAGTSLKEIDAALDEHNQMLSFDPPNFDGDGSLGGALACNHSGPSRPWAGSVRDMVLGIRLINGNAEHLRFGGQVMKNVAGFDIARLQAGAMGCLGVITEISLKVMPKHAQSQTLVCDIDSADEAIGIMNFYRSCATPITGACWYSGRIYLRFEGASSAVKSAIEKFFAKYSSAEILEDSVKFWQKLRDHKLDFFAGTSPLWRYSVKPSLPLPASNEDYLIDWGGAQRWLRSDKERAQLVEQIPNAAGQVSLFQHGDRSSEIFHPPSAVSKKLHQRLKHSFDANGVFNPGRLYSWL